MSLAEIFEEKSAPQGRRRQRKLLGLQGLISIQQRDRLYCL
ncbi:hypothetical protein P7I93_33535 (plasmid) [Pseudomonas aeruginosa]|nr:hypothetical protein [Pseudomonas aeruginosa]MDE5271824.1 hypothetical protein [Pseudomonas aeruginosa]MDE5284435.1 hypothetical protein [Pseudomonas aeruginosa]WGX59084.1 hypothetical protein P7I93_33535 [Pseudomonas aeruginosa]